MMKRIVVLATVVAMAASTGLFAQAKPAAKAKPAVKQAAKPAVKQAAKPAVKQAAAPAAAPAAKKAPELSAEAIAAEKAFREAIAAGEPLTAENQFKKLVDANPNPDPELYWLGAEVARQSGKAAARRDRLQNFLRQSQSKDWNDKTEQAAWELCLGANDCDQYLRLCKHMQPSMKLFNIGVQMLGSYRQAKRSSDFLKICAGMLAAFKTDNAKRAIISRMAEMYRDRAPGFDAEKAQKLALENPLDNMGLLWSDMEWTRDLFNQKWRLEFCAKNKKLLPPGLFSWISQIEYDPKKNPQGRALWAMYLPDIEKLCLDGPCAPSIALDWLRMRVNLSDEIIPRAQTNKVSAALLDCFIRAAKHEPKINRAQLQELVWNTARQNLLTRADVAELRRKAPDCLNDEMCTGWGGVCELADKRTNAAPVMAFIKNNPDRFGVAWRSVGTLLKYGETAKVLEILNEHIDRSAGFDGHALMNTLSDKRYDNATRAKLLKGGYQRTGYNSSWAWLKNDKNNPNRWKWMNEEPVKSFVASIKESDVGTDRLLYLRGQMAMLRRGNGNVAPDKAHELMRQANAAYPGAYRNDGSRNSGNWYSIYSMYADLCRHNSESANLMVQTLSGKMSRDMNWEPYNHALSHSWRAKGGALPHIKATAEKAAIFEDWSAFGDYAVAGDALDPKTKQLPVKFDYAKMQPATLRGFIWRNMRERRFPAELNVQLVGDFYRNYKPGTFDMEWNRELIDYCVKPYVQATNALCAKLPWEELAQHVLDKDYGRGDIARKFLYEAAWPAGKRDQYVNRYLEAMKGFDAPTYATELVNLINGSIVRDSMDKEGKTPDEFGPILRERLLPALKAVGAKDAPLVYFPNDWWCDKYFTYFDKKKGVDDLKTLAQQFQEQTVRLLNAGARGYWVDDGRGRYQMYLGAFDRAMAASNQVEMVKTAYCLGRYFHNWRAGGANALSARLSSCKQFNRWQPLYLIVTGLTPGYGEGWIQTTCAKLRAEAATKLPGIYPVGEKDPAYPLYVAADEYNRNNLERAHELLMKKQNLAVFEREAPNLPPDFTGWGIEQLRLERGKDDELLIKARNIATTLLMNEAKIPASLAAAAILVRAESFRDQQNFEAAKLEYQSIRNSPVYSATPSGRKAMFRAVDLMIDTGNVGGAEQTIEYWLSQPDPEIQAEAHYFLARIAFDRKDYPETIKQLRKVFEIDFTHTEARFLQGQWKLATNSEVDETDVLIGDLADRTVIRPGQQLTVTVQDRNLSVAGGGASIPVIMTTRPGNDQERILLYPSARDPNLFKGTIDVKLGEAVASNLVLEVRGNDVASYVIEPDFLKLRGLPLNNPKVLRVVDDAKLAIGTGAPRVEEKQVKKDLESSLDGDGGNRSLAGTLRPGNPLYVVVSDKDRSRGEGSAVEVEVKTSSGDRLAALRLEEVAPFTGVFRGQVGTSLPPPRAYASDTAAGFNAGDVINSTKDGHWKSLMDSQPGKWIAVDTMASHLVSNATIVMSAPEEIRSIRLKGRLGAELLELGQLPKQEAGRRAGFRRFETRVNKALHSVRDIYGLFEGSKAGRGMILTNVAFKADFAKDRRPLVNYFRGAFLQPAGHDFFRLRVNPEKMSGDTFRGLWLKVQLDGKSIFEGQGPTVADKIIASKVTPNVHLLEIFVTSTSANDSFDMLWEPYSEEARPVPMDWFDAEKHPQITEFLEDKAEIVRTKDGYVAKFKKPTRLRTLQWEFADRTGPGVEVHKLEIVDADGKTVIPSETDFTDAQQNDTLEVAPGDHISVSYVDERTSSGQKRILTRGIGSSFNNAKIGFFFEEVSQGRGGANASSLYEAFRFMPGDKLLVSVQDPDCDITAEADKVPVTVTTRSGQKKNLMLIEQKKAFANMGGQGDTEGIHTGLFMGLLRTARAGDTNANAKALLVKTDDVLELTYDDRENTDPGVPFVRNAVVQSSRLTKPRLTLFDCTKTKVEDHSSDAMARLALIRRRPGNEQVKVLYTDVNTAAPMDKSVVDGDEEIPVNVACPVIMRVNDPCRARHSASTIKVELVAGSELEAADADGRDPEGVTIKLGVGAGFGGVKLTRGGESGDEAKAAGSFNGTLSLCLGQLDPNLELREDSRPLSVTGSDTIRLRVLDEDDQPVIEKTLKLVSDASMGLMDSTWNAERNAAHVGERFFLRVEDADRDLTDQPDQIEAEVKAMRSGAVRRMVLTETLPHSGVFTGMVRPVILAPGEEVPDIVTGGVVRVGQEFSITNEDRFAVRYGDNILFTYRDENTLPGTESPLTLCATGIVHKGADGSIRMFSKRFRDNDMGVLVQFRLAECLFEQAKEFRRLKQKERSAEVIAEGKFILEEALRNYPNSAHAMQGEFLLANLYQELANEQKEMKEMEKARPLYTEALARFSTMLSIWPDGEYAARAQYHKAFCLEMLGDYPRSSEEYVKMTYLYPESDLVGDATIRLANYYYKQEKRYDIAARIYENFQRRFPQHSKSPRALFMCGACFVKQGEYLVEKANKEKKRAPDGDVQKFYKRAVKAFDKMAVEYRETTTPDQRGQALYWAGDASLRARDYPAAYLYLKRTVLEYPETEWARRARGLLLQEARTFKDLEE